MTKQEFTDIYLNILHELSLLRHVHGDLETERDQARAANAELEQSRMRWHDQFLSMGRKRDELEAERDELEAERDELRQERDDAKAAGIGDLNDIYYQKATIRRLEARCAALEVDKAVLDASNVVLRAGQGNWPTSDTDDKPLPRVISSDELRPGQTVAIHMVSGGWGLSVVEAGGTVEDHHTIVLLADVTPGPLDEWEEELLDEIAEMNAPAPRLTVHALNTAPAGSVVESAGKKWTKNHDGTWFRVSAFGQHRRDSEEMISLGHADATLHLPERGDHE